MADEREIKNGDVVRLRSGGRTYTVAQIGTPRDAPEGATVYAEVVWDSTSGGIHQERVPLHTLTKAG